MDQISPSSLHFTFQFFLFSLTLFFLSIFILDCLLFSHYSVLFFLSIPMEFFYVFQLDSSPFFTIYITRTLFPFFFHFSASFTSSSISNPSSLLSFFSLSFSYTFWKERMNEREIKNEGKRRKEKRWNETEGSLSLLSLSFLLSFSFIFFPSRIYTHQNINEIYSTFNFHSFLYLFPFNFFLLSLSLVLSFSTLFVDN